MPILNVEIITRPDEQIHSDVVQELADRAGQIFGSLPGGTWVKIFLVARENYAENVNPLEELSPVFVSVIKSKLPPSDLLQIEATQLAQAFAQVLNRPEENIHIIYLPEGTGRVAFGGKLLTG